MLISFLKVLDRQGMLKGDLNWIQRDGLTYLMNTEIEDEIAFEKVRMENTAIASNPQTGQAYLQHILSNTEQEDELEAELREEGFEVDWHTPIDPSEVEDVLRNLGLDVPTK